MRAGLEMSSGVKRIFREKAAMASSTFVNKAIRMAGTFGRATAMLVLASWSGIAAAGAIQTEGNWTVAPDGSAEYSLPIAVPPGTAGVAPALSLNYSSNNGDGILGVGWSLGGLPSIVRCPQTLAQDGAIISVNFTATDRFCYGGHRLVMVSGTAYGADSATYRTEVDQFSLITSHGAASGGGPSYFTVQTKSGQILEFGNTTNSANSFVQAVGDANVPSGVARAWMVDQVSDRLGNYYTVTYSAETSSGETHPLEIDYTANKSSGNTLSAYNSVKFVYNGSSQTRSYSILSHTSGAILTTSALLTNVRSYAGANLVHDYQLTYQTGSTERPQLISIAHCDDGTLGCLPSTSFSWPNTPAPLSSSLQSLTASSDSACTVGAMQYWVPYVADLDNDGRDDILWVYENAPLASAPGPTGRYRIWYSKGNGSFKCVIPSFSSDSSGFSGTAYRGTPSFGDFTGTGRTDVLLTGDPTSAPTPGTPAQLWLNSGDESGTFTADTNPAQILTRLGSGRGNILQVLTDDFLGKGTTQVAVVNQVSPPAISTTQICIVPTDFNTDTSGCSPINDPTGVFPYNGIFSVFDGSFKGDGRTGLYVDTCATTTPYNCVRGLVTGNADGTYTAQKVSLPALANMQAFVTVGDFNGDGIADLIFNPICTTTDGVTGCGSGVAQTTGKLIVLLGRGDGTFDPPVAFTPGASLAGYKVVPGHFSGTTLTDLLMDEEDANGVSTGNQVLFTSNGDGTFTQNVWKVGTGTSGARPFAGDFVGVGHDSVLWDTVQGDTQSPPDLRSSGTDKVALANAAVPDLVSTVTSGLGAVTNINYAPMSTGAPLYVKDVIGTASYPTYPSIAQQTAQPLVSSVSTSDGAGGTRSFSYSYSGLRSDMQGRGSLGFSGFAVADNATGITTATAYNQIFPEIGLPGVVIVTAAGNKSPLSSTTINYQTVTEQTGQPAVNFVGQSSTSQTIHTDLDGTSLPLGGSSTSYDCSPTSGLCYGNVTNYTTTPDSGYQTVTTYTYPSANPPTGCPTSFDTTHWLITAVCQITVTDTVPSSVSMNRTTSFTYQANTGLVAKAINGGCATLQTDGTCAATFSTPTQDTEQLQLTTEYQYDTFGNQTSIAVEPSDTGVSTRTTGATWLTGTNLNMSGSTAATQQNSQFPQTVTDAANYSSNYGYDVRFGSTVTTVDLNGLKTVSPVDSFGRTTKVIGPDGTGTMYVYAYCNGFASRPAKAPTVSNCPKYGVYAAIATPEDKNGMQIGPVTATIYDMLGRAVQTDTTSFDGTSSNRIQTGYDNAGRVSFVTVPFSASGAPPSCTTATPPACSLATASTQPSPPSNITTSWTYDALSRVLTVTEPDSTTSNGYHLSATNGYDGLTQTRKLPVDTWPGAANGGTEIYTYVRNALGQITSAQDPINNTTTNSQNFGTTYAYLPFGKVASVTDPAGNAVTYNYDPLGRRVGLADFDTGSRSATYYSTGELKSVTEPGAAVGAKAITTTYKFDQLGRITTRASSDGFSSAWSYDQAGALGKLASSQASGPGGGYPGGSGVSYQYDSFGRLYTTQIQFGSQLMTFTDQYVALGSAGAGRLASVSDSVSGAVTGYGYNSSGYFNQVCRGAACSTTTTPVYVISKADAALRPLTVNYGSATFTNSQPSGTSSSVTDTFYYDQLNQLTVANNAAASKTFGYDEATGNLATKSDTGAFTYGPAGGAGPHQLQSIGPITNPTIPESEPVSASYNYDPRGNMTAGEDNATYSWTSFDRPMKISKDGANVLYYYDANYQRIAAQTTSPGTLAKLYLRDGSGSLAEATLDQNGNFATVLDYFSAGDQAVGMLITPFSGGSATTQSTPGTPIMDYFHTDAQGSIIGISGDNGLVTESDSYDPWGKRRQTNGADDPNDRVTSTVSYGYIDEEHIAGVFDLINLNARLYNSHTGRFISPDPIGLSGGRNLYAYSGNNPTTRNDKSGLVGSPPDAIGYCNCYYMDLGGAGLSAADAGPGGSHGSFGGGDRFSNSNQGASEGRSTPQTPPSDSGPTKGTDPTPGSWSESPDGLTRTFNGPGITVTDHSPSGFEGPLPPSVTKPSAGNPDSNGGGVGFGSGFELGFKQAALGPQSVRVSKLLQNSSDWRFHLGVLSGGEVGAFVGSGAFFATDGAARSPVIESPPSPLPNQIVLDAMKSDRIQKMAADPGCDCSEIAERLLEDAGGDGQIIEATPSKPGDLNAMENGKLETDYYYHQVYTDGPFVYDPRLSPGAIPLNEWQQQMLKLNPNGVQFTLSPKW